MFDVVFLHYESRYWVDFSVALRVGGLLQIDPMLVVVCSSCVSDSNRFVVSSDIGFIAATIYNQYAIAKYYSV